MNKYIEQEEVRRKMLAAYPLLQKELLNETIDSMESVDVVKVVRCKDCKHRDDGEGLCTGRGWPMQIVPGDGFCDKGKMK